jgi:hypothetical protein
LHLDIISLRLTKERKQKERKGEREKGSLLFSRYS